MAEQEARLFGVEPASPGELLRAMLADRRWTQDELATITDRSRQQIIDIASDRRGITAEMAVALAAAFGNTPDVWLRIDASYRLSKTNDDGETVRRRARLFELAPVKDMQRRGWIGNTADLDATEGELKRFFGVETLDVAPEFPVSFRKSSSLSDLNPQQRVWVFRVRQVAAALPVPEFKPDKISALKQELRILAAYPKEVSRVPDVMRNHGIRFVIVEPLPGSKLDGCTFWLDEKTPVVGMSLLHDRLDNFWFVLMHEVAHVQNGDAISVDSELAVRERAQPFLKDIEERRADEDAANTLVPKEELESFIRRVGPIYAKPNIVQFAHRIKIHPGIIVGQLQHRAELGYDSNRDLLPKIRNHVISTSVTDGWGNTLSPDTL